MSVADFFIAPSAAPSTAAITLLGANAASGTASETIAKGNLEAGAAVFQVQAAFSNQVDSIAAIEQMQATINNGFGQTITGAGLETGAPLEKVQLASLANPIAANIPLEMLGNITQENAPSAIASNMLGHFTAKNNVSAARAVTSAANPTFQYQSESHPLIDGNTLGGEAASVTSQNITSVLGQAYKGGALNVHFDVAPQSPLQSNLPQAPIEASAAIAATTAPLSADIVTPTTANVITPDAPQPATSSVTPAGVVAPAGAVANANADTSAISIAPSVLKTAAVIKSDMLTAPTAVLENNIAQVMVEGDKPVPGTTPLQGSRTNPLLASLVKTDIPAPEAVQAHISAAQASSAQAEAGSKRVSTASRTAPAASGAASTVKANGPNAQSVKPVTPEFIPYQPQAASAAAPVKPVINFAWTLESLGGQDSSNTQEQVALGLPTTNGASPTGLAHSLFGGRLTPTLGGNLSHQLAVNVTQAIEDGTNEFTIRLNPQEMGRVTVRLTFADNGTLKASIFAEQPETLDLLQRDVRGLEKALNNNGKTNDLTIEYSLDQGGNESAGKAFAEAALEEGLQATIDANNMEASDLADMAEESEEIPLEIILQNVSAETGIDVLI